MKYCDDNNKNEDINMTANNNFTSPCIQTKKTKNFLVSQILTVRFYLFS